MGGEVVDRIYGCLIGGAIGDALGASVENWTHEQIRAEYGRLESFHRYSNPHAKGMPGSVTDDTVMAHYLSIAIAERGGRVTPDEFAETLREHLNRDRVWVSEEIAIQKLAAGMNPWETGRNNIPSGSAVTGIAPVGVVNAANPRQAYQDGYNLASVNQDGVERDAGATAAAGIAAAFDRDATVEDVVSAMLTHSSETVFRSLDLALGLVEESESVEDFVDAFYDQLLDWSWPAVAWDRDAYQEGRVFSGSAVEALPALVGILRLCGDDPNEAIVEAANFGRDCDTIGAATGNVVGALHGAAALREDWVEQCTEANAEFFEEVHGDGDEGFEAMARRLAEALASERERAAQRASTLDDLL